MKISPMEISRQTFGRRFRGFDPDEVHTYLTFVAEEISTLQRERDTLRQEANSLKAVVDDYKQREAILKNTLLTAQKVADEIRDTARKHSQGIVKEAELQADRLVELAQTRAHDIERTLLDLRAQRAAMRSDIRAAINRVAQVIALQEEAEDPDNLHFLLRREEA